MELKLESVLSRHSKVTSTAVSSDALQYMMIIVDVINAMKKNVEEIDIRYGAFSYRER